MAWRGALEPPPEDSARTKLFDREIQFRDSHTEAETKTNSWPNPRKKEWSYIYIYFCVYCQGKHNMFSIIIMVATVDDYARHPNVSYLWFVFGVLFSFSGFVARVTCSAATLGRLFICLFVCLFVCLFFVCGRCVSALHLDTLNKQRAMILVRSFMGGRYEEMRPELVSTKVCMLYGWCSYLVRSKLLLPKLPRNLLVLFVVFFRFAQVCQIHSELFFPPTKKKKRAAV